MVRGLQSRPGGRGIRQDGGVDNGLWLLLQAVSQREGQTREGKGRRLADVPPDARYGITAAEADHMLRNQDGVCAICRVATAAHVDHDHDTGAVRALLCFNCNGGLGQFSDDPHVVRAAAEYVEFHRLSRFVLAAAAAAGLGPVQAIRPGEPPVGSDRRPGGRSTSTRTTGRTSGSRRRKTAGEADG
jgi:hypothetical protein